MPNNTIDIKLIYIFLDMLLLGMRQFIQKHTNHQIITKRVYMNNLVPITIVINIYNHIGENKYNHFSLINIAFLVRKHKVHWLIFYWWIIKMWLDLDTHKNKKL